MATPRAEVASINPLIGRNLNDTVENLCICIDELAASDNAASCLLFRCISAALRYETQQLPPQQSTQPNTLPQ